MVEVAALHHLKSSIALVNLLKIDGIHSLVSEALGRSPLGHFVFGWQAPDAGNIEILHQFGAEEQKDRYLQPLEDGKICSSYLRWRRRGSQSIGGKEDIERIRRQNDKIVQSA